MLEIDISRNNSQTNLHVLMIRGDIFGSLPIISGSKKNWSGVSDIVQYPVLQYGWWKALPQTQNQLPHTAARTGELSYSTAEVICTLTSLPEAEQNIDQGQTDIYDARIFRSISKAIVLLALAEAPCREKYMRGIKQLIPRMLAAAKSSWTISAKSYRQIL